MNPRFGVVPPYPAGPAVAVLDALGWEQAHIFGASLGGVIAQRIALRHPGRVLSVVSASAMPSDVSGSERHGICVSACWPSSPGPSSPRAGKATSSCRSCSPAKSPPPATRSTRMPRGSGSNARPPAAPGTPRRKAGRSAPLARPEAARTAQTRPHPARRPGPHPARQRCPRHRRSHRRRPPGGPPGVGHDLPAPLWPAIANEVRQLADRAATSSR
jgi:pimeloyl-ACP methyl ester carboxylesterase